MLIKAMISHYKPLENNTSDKIGVLSISDYVQLLERTISLPRDLFIEIVSYL